jgi:signal transduction histidine kinase
MTTLEHNEQASPGPRWRGPGLILLIGLVQIVGTTVAGHRQPDRTTLDVLGYALLVAGPLALFARRRFPATTLLVNFAATLTYVVLDYPRGPIFFALIVALFSAVLAGRRVVAWAVLAAGYGSFLWLPRAANIDPAPTLGAIIGLAAWLGLLGTLAEVARVRRETATERARMQAEERRRRASEERLRIARELHDVLGHHISLINVQAGVALHLIEEKPEQARPALSAIKDASKEALSELRSVLAILRQVDEDPPRSPSPSLSRIEELVSRARTAGLSVHTEVTGEARPLPFGVDLAGYRIVQEALTNVARHAGPATATVHVTYGERDVTVQVDDDGPGSRARKPSSGGSGIPGMRERAVAVGGGFEAGPRPEGGFRVRARLPVDGLP